MDYESVKTCLRKICRATALFVRDFDYPGYTFNELNVLGTIARHPGIIARDIGGYNAIDQGYLSKILKKLEQGGLIVRTAEKRPPFEKTLAVTPAGETVYAAAERLVDKSIEDRLSALNTAEREAFFEYAAETAGCLEKMLPDVPEQHTDSGR